MFKYLCKRIGLFIVSLFIIMTMLFVLIRMLPNPVVAVTGGYARQLEDMRRAWGYYDPIVVQYGIFLKNLFTSFNWGFCTTVGTFLQPVEEYLASKIPATLYVNILSLVFSVPLGILFGVIAAVFKNRWQDQNGKWQSRVSVVAEHVEFKAKVEKKEEQEPAVKESASKKTSKMPVFQSQESEPMPKAANGFDIF